MSSFHKQTTRDIVSSAMKVFSPLLMFSSRLVITVFFLSVIPATAEDSKGAYTVGGGVGSVECSKFVSVMEQARHNWLVTKGYTNDSSSFAMYLAGFQTAYNHAEPDTCDIFDGLDYDTLLSWVEIYCRTHPQDRFGTASIALARQLHPNRLRNCKE